MTHLGQQVTKHYTSTRCEDGSGYEWVAREKDRTNLFKLEFRPYPHYIHREEHSLEEIQGLLESLSNYGAQYNFVILAPKGKVGAGHLRQGDAFLETFKLCHLLDNTTLLAMPYKKMAGTLYELLQERPQMQATIEHTFFENSYFNQMIDFLLKRSSLVPEVLQNLERVPTFDRAKPTIFITTHVEQEMAAITLMNKGLIKGPGVIAAIPDPWREGSLVSMSSPINLKEDKGLHMVIVHDYATAREFRRLRPNSSAKVFPLGTASDPYFLFHPGEEYNRPFHIGIEFSGNYLHKYGELIIRFIRSIKDELSKEMIVLTIHAMHHEKIVRMIEYLLYELGIAHLGNIRLLYAHTLEEAIDTRRKYSRGILDAGWPAPHVVISKGGEVPLEHRGRQLIVGVWGEGHEEQDILAGVHEGRAVDFRGLPPTEWYSTIVEVYRKRKLQPPSVPQSLAVFAPLLLIDPQFVLRASPKTIMERL